MLFCLHLFVYLFVYIFLPDADGDEEVIVSPKLSVPIDQESRKDSLFDQNVGPPLDPTQLRNYKTIEQILLRMNRLCVHQSTGSDVVGEQKLGSGYAFRGRIPKMLELPPHYA